MILPQTIKTKCSPNHQASCAWESFSYRTQHVYSRHTLATSSRLYCFISFDDMVAFQLVVAAHPPIQRNGTPSRASAESHVSFLERVNKDKQRASPPLTVYPFVKIRFPWAWAFLLEHGKSITPNLQMLRCLKAVVLFSAVLNAANVIVTSALPLVSGTDDL